MIFQRFWRAIIIILCAKIVAKTSAKSARRLSYERIRRFAPLRQSSSNASDAAGRA
jgi:hypothetical protein